MKPENYNKMVMRNHKRIEEECIKLGDDYYCAACGSQIMAARVAHPIHDGPFPMSGSGRCQYEMRPYCPICEDEPDSSGAPINPKGSYSNP